MSRHRPRRSLRSISEINMTPLIDLTFLLLITFIITFPLVEQGIPVRLPSARAEPLESASAVTLTLDETGALFLDREAISIDSLERILLERIEQTGDFSVMVRGDERLPYGKIVAVLRVLRRARITRMALVTQDEG